MPDLLIDSDIFVWVGMPNPSAAEFDEARRAFALPREWTELALEPHNHPAFTSLGSASNLILRTATI